MPPIGSDDETPQPQRRRVTHAYVLDQGHGTALDPEHTKMSASMKVAWAIGSFIAVAGFFAGVQLTRVLYRMERSEERIGELTASTSKLQTAVKQTRRAVIKAVNEKVSKGIVTCNRDALRGHGDVQCPAVFVGAVTTEEEPE